MTEVQYESLGNATADTSASTNVSARVPRVYRGYDGVPGALRISPDQNYTFSWDAPTELLTLRHASIKAAAEFGRRNTDKEIVVLYSGGLDSEWVCESLFTAGVPFRPLVVNYMGANEHDLLWARRWLSRTKLEDQAIWWDFDLRAWYGSNEQREIARASQLAELAYTGQFKAILEHMSGDRIFLSGYDEPVITADDSQRVRNWNLTYNERHCAIHKFGHAFGVPMEPGGWVTANVFAAYVHCPMWKWLAHNLCGPLTWNSELVKTRIYGSAFPMMTARPKYTGFENMLDVVVPATSRWKEECLQVYGTNWLQDWTMPITDVWASIRNSLQLDAASGETA